MSTIVSLHVSNLDSREQSRQRGACGSCKFMLICNSFHFPQSLPHLHATTWLLVI